MLRLGLLVAVAALFALIPAGQASAADFKLNVVYAGTGEGIVECEVEGILEECEDEYPAGTEVFLEPFEEEGSEFVEFSGDCGPLACELEMDQEHTVTVVFDLLPVEEFELSILEEGTGTGSVQCELEEGPVPCEPTYPEGTEVTILATADKGSEFVEFSGDCGPTVCELEMDEDKEVIVVFDLVESEEGEEEESGGPGGGGGGGAPPAAPQAPISLPSPVAAGQGRAKISGAGLYKGGKATLRISCKGGGPCKGTVKLTARLGVGGKTKQVTVGRASFDLKAGASKALTIKLSAPAKRLLGKGRTLTAKASGSGVIASTVKIKPTER